MVCQKALLRLKRCQKVKKSSLSLDFLHWLEIWHLHEISMVNDKWYAITFPRSLTFTQDFHSQWHMTCCYISYAVPNLTITQDFHSQWHMAWCYTLKHLPGQQLMACFHTLRHMWYVDGKCDRVNVNEIYGIHLPCPNVMLPYFAVCVCVMCCSMCGSVYIYSVKRITETRTEHHHICGIRPQSHTKNFI